MFETHSTTDDNERGVATGWLPGRLSRSGRDNARALGDRRRDDGIAAVFTSDLARAVETATIAFGDTGVPILHDWRLRECDYGRLNGAPAAEVHERVRYVDEPYPDGESWTQAAERVGQFVDALPTRWSGRRVLIIGHVATRWGLEHRLMGRTIHDLAKEKFEWRPGWEYRLE